MPDRPSELNFGLIDSERESPVNENPSAATQSALPPGQTPPVHWLRALPEHGVILCTEHQTCYTPGKNLRLHTLRQHAVKGERTKEIDRWVEAQNVAAQVTCPPDYSPFIPGL